MTSADARTSLMIVDDEPENLDVLEELLTRAGYRVAAFPSGELALAAALQEAPGLVLLDVRMPGMDGYEVCRRFKADAGLQPIPILFISALVATDDIAAGFACGGVDYLGKPFRQSEVLARVRTHLALRDAYVRLAAEHANLRVLEHQRDMLTRMLVHDMRGPLQVIGGHLELLAGYSASVPWPNDECDSLQAATRGVRSLNQLVCNLVDLSRLETVGMPVHLRPVSAAAVFQAALALALAPANRYQIVLQIADDCPWLLCDLDLCARIIANLLTNVFKHAPHPGPIVLGAAPHPAGVRLWVSDCGPGIPAQFHQRIFEKFEVADQLLGRARASSGLGLAFCKLAAIAQGGSIGVDSLLGSGSTFWCTLPVAPATGP
jgi:two-component system sensor histidine kinase/response regulator